MRIDMNGEGELSVTAENLDEAQGLLTFVNIVGPRKARQSKKMTGADAPIKRRKRTNSKECPVCGKRKKYMGQHYRLSHPGVEYKKELIV